MKDKVPSKELRDRLGIDDIFDAKRRHWLGEEMYGVR